MLGPLGPRASFVSTIKKSTLAALFVKHGNDHWDRFEQCKDNSLKTLYGGTMKVLKRLGLASAWLDGRPRGRLLEV